VSWLSINDLAFYVPIGLIGIWRWMVWSIKKIASVFYEEIPPEALQEKMTLSVRSPVYNEDPDILRKAIESWRNNKPEEIILAVDRTDIENIKLCQSFSGTPDVMIQTIVIEEPGKRPALAAGIRAATGQIVALVDSDTIWENGLKEKALAPFSIEKIGGVVTRQNAYETKSVWQKITDIMWDIRNFDEWTSQIAMGKVVTCLSGRTAFYRRYIILPVLEQFLNEIIFGKKKESGEDKCLTRLIQDAGWHTYYQKSARVYSSAADNFRQFWNQRLRWTRNSYNSDLVSLSQSWTWRHPYLAFYMIDRFISPFTTALSPIFFIHAIYYQHWIIVTSLLIWWTFSRGIKIIPHIKNKPKDIIILPIYVLASFIIAIAKIYAMVTIRDQKWIRAGEERKEKTTDKIRRIVIPAFLMGMIFYGLFYLVFFFL